MKVEFNQGCFLDYTARKFYRRDQIVEEDHEYLFRFNNQRGPHRAAALNQVHVWMSYIGTNWDEELK
jgi:hypothetical protein